VEYNAAGFGAFMEVLFQVGTFWVLIPFSGLVGYQRFRSPCCLHLHCKVTSGAWSP